MVLASRSVSRVAVVGKPVDGRPLLGSLQRMDFLRFLAVNRHAFGSAATRTMGSLIRQLQAASDGAAVLTCPCDAPLRDALTALVGSKMYGLPIVDGAGRLHSHLRMQDVEHLAFLPAHEFEKCVDTPVGAFLRDRAKTAADASVYVSPFPITIRVGDCVGSVVELMATAALKSVSVVDDNMRPVGEVSVVDLFQELVKLH